MNFSFLNKNRKGGWNSESGCTGLEIAALVSTVAGTGLQVAASQGEKSAMNHAAEAEVLRQQDYAKRGQQVFENSLEKSTPLNVNKQIGEGTDRATQEYNKVQSLPTSTSTGGELGKAVADTNVQGQAHIANAQAAPLQGYDAYSISQWIKDLQANSQLRQNDSFAQASNRVLPLELQAAQNSKAGLAGIGSLLTTAGGLAGTYGAVTAPTTGTNIIGNSFANSLPKATIPLQQSVNPFGLPMASIYNLYPQ